MTGLKCKVCNGKLQMGSNGEFAKCESCGVEYSLETLRSMVQALQGTDVVQRQPEQENIKKPLAAVDEKNDDKKMPYDKAMREYKRLNEEKKAEKKKNAIISIICAVAIFIVSSIVLSFFDGHMFTRAYWVPYDIGFFGDVVIAVIVHVALWGGWVSILKFLFSFAVNIWQFNKSISCDDVSKLRDDAEKALNRNPSRTIEAKDLTRKADYMGEVLSAIYGDNYIPKKYSVVANEQSTTGSQAPPSGNIVHEPKEELEYVSKVFAKVLGTGNIRCLSCNYLQRNNRLVCFECGVKFR